MTVTKAHHARGVAEELLRIRASKEFTEQMNAETMKKTMKTAAAGTAMAGALGLGVLATAGIAGAKPGNPGPQPNPPGPGVAGPQNPGNGNGNGNGQGNWGGEAVWLPGDPPGHNPFGPPGQVMQMPTLTIPSLIDLPGDIDIPAGTVLDPNPFLGVPPGQWGQINLLGDLNPLNISWLPPGSDLMAPLSLEWNAELGAWGVVMNGAFTPYPIQFPAPTG